MAIGEALKKNKTITELDITHSKLEKQAALDFVSLFSANMALTKLYMGDCGVDDDVLSELCKHLLNVPAKTSLTQIYLPRNDIGKSMGTRSQLAMSRLIDVLSSTRIKVLDFSHNHLNDDCIQLLVEGLKDNYYCSYLNLKDNKISDDGASAIGEMLTRNVALKDLDLSHNRISSRGAIRILHGLRTNNFLLKLNLRNNRIDDEGAKEIAKEFSLNRNNVQELYLGSNLIRIQGAMALADMLKKNTTLTKFDMQGILLEIDGAPPTEQKPKYSSYTSLSNGSELDRTKRDSSRDYIHPTNKIDLGSSKEYDKYERSTSPLQSSSSYFNSDSEFREYESITKDLKKLYNSGIIPNNNTANDIEYQRLIVDRLEKQRRSPTHNNTINPISSVPKNTDSSPQSTSSKMLLEESLRMLQTQTQQQNPLPLPLSASHREYHPTSTVSHVYYEAPTQQSVNNTSIVRESSSAIELAKAEFESRLRQEILNLEERLNLKISEVDFNTSRELNTMHRMLEDRLDQQQKVMSKMAEEQRWIEEEGIQLRVEHEARIQEQIKSIRLDLMDQIKTMEERFKNNTGSQFSQLEQSIQNVETNSTDLNSKMIRSQQNYTALTDRVEFLEKHLLGSQFANRYRKLDGPVLGQSTYHGKSTLHHSPPSQLTSTSMLSTRASTNGRMVEENDMYANNQNNISISESVKSLNFGNNSSRLTSYELSMAAQREHRNGNPSYIQQQHQDNYFRDSIPDDRSESSVGDVSVDEASLRQLQALLGRAHSKLKQTTLLTGAKHSPPTSHYSYN